MKRLISIMLSVCLMLCGVTVFAENEITSIKISVKNTTMAVGETQKISVTKSPVNAEDVQYEYISDNPDVVTAAIGTLIAKSVGVASITVRVSGTDISDTIKIEVSDSTQEIPVEKITLKSSYIYIEQYKREKINYTVLPENATDCGVNFESSDTAVLTVDNKGYVYAKREGSASVIIKSDDGKAKAVVRVYVTGNDRYYDDDDDKRVRSLYITYDDENVDDEFELMERSSVQLSAKIYPSSASSKGVIWSSSDKRIATVDKNGKVTAVKKGSCTIYAKSEERTSVRDSFKLVVTDYIRYPDSIKIEPDKNAVLKTGSRVKMWAEISPTDTTERELYWQVSGNAKIDQSGMLTINDGGEIKVYAYSKNREVKGEYVINAEYSEDFFGLYGEKYNQPKSRRFKIHLDEMVSEWSARNSIFASADPCGNSDRIDINISADDKTITVSPADTWPQGDVYIFIKSSLSDIYGNQTGKNLKYKLNIRGTAYEA